MRTLSVARLVGISICIIVFCGSFVLPVLGQTLIPLHIKKGTSLIRLAGEFCHNTSDWHEIARINKLKPPYLIRENSTLQIPLAMLRVKNLSAQVAMTKDTVSLLKGEKVMGQVHNNDQLLPGQTLVTDESGYAYIVFPDNKFTRVAPASKLTLNYLLRLADGDVKTELLLTKGRIRHLIKQKLRPNETFRTRTPVAVTGVRGTDFRMKVAEDGSNIVETLSGTVRLSAAGQAVALHQGEGSKVVDGLAPAKPRVLPQAPKSIELQPVYKALPILIPLPAQPGILSYRVRITKDSMGNDPVWEKLINDGNSIRLDALADGKYFLFITAINKDHYESLPHGPLPLSLRTVPAAPFFSSPRNDSLSWEEKVTVKWLESADATAYQIDLSDDKEFHHIIASDSLNTLSYTTPSLAPGTYYFRVRAVAADGFISRDSLPLSWKVMKPAPIDMGSPSKDGHLTIQWAPAGESAAYELQIARDHAFQDIVYSRQGLTEPSCTINEYIDPGSYELRIRFALEGGEFSPWMPSQKMVIEAGPVGTEHLLLVASFLALIILL